MVGNIKDFVIDAFDYLDVLETVSIDHSVNRYLLEYIANGYVKYGTTENFIKNADEWLRKGIGMFREIGFDHDKHQVCATIDLIDQVVVIDDALMDSLEYIINVQKKYGMVIKYSSAQSGTGTTTLCRFFEMIQRVYPQIKDRFKGLGSSESKVMAEVVMNPKTRRIYRVDPGDIERTKDQMEILIGRAKDSVMKRKELLMDFKFTAADIDT